MFQSTVPLMMLFKHRMSTALQDKRVTNSIAKEEEKAWKQLQMKSAYICDRGKKPSTQGHATLFPYQPCQIIIK